MKYTLVGVDGNAYAIMGYTAIAMKAAGLRDKINQMYEEAKSGDYYHLIAVCNRYVEMANETLGLEDEYEEDEY